MGPISRPTRLLASDLACIRGGRTVFSGLSFAVGAGEAEQAHAGLHGRADGLAGLRGGLNGRR